MQSKLIDPSFNPRFFTAFIRKVIEDPRVAITELVANAWDAGATEVAVVWPLTEEGGEISVTDNGYGMTNEEFQSRWREMSYDRTSDQGTVVELRDGSIRRVFGRNGVGRFGMFCFSDKYSVDTWKNGEMNSFKVTRNTKPFELEYVGTGQKTGTGTRISCIRTIPSSIFVTPDTIEKWLQEKFIDATDFDLTINGKRIDLGLCEKTFETTVVFFEICDIL